MEAHPEHCEHCDHGCTHSHNPYEPLGLTTGPPVPSASRQLFSAGQKGAYITPDGLTVASGNWRPVICIHCSYRTLTPIEALLPLEPFVARDLDGNAVAICGTCKADVRDGYRPGTGPHSRRARRQRN